MNTDPHKSTTYCGCDDGAGYTCERHREEFFQDLTSAGDVIPRPRSPQEALNVAALPTEAAKRKEYPLATGLLDYFALALMEVAHVSWVGNEQHNPGQPLHWDRSKSTDEADALMRHFKDRGTRDSDGMRHSAKVAWRSLALLQKEIEEEGGL